MAVLGFEARLYINSGTGAAPVWDEVACVRDLTLNMEGAAVDVTCRELRGQRGQVVGLHDVGADFTLITQQPNSAEVNTIINAWWNRTQLHFLIYDGDVTDANASGVYGLFEVQNITRGENIEDALTYDVSIIQPDSPNPAEWTTGANPTPTFP